MDFYTILPWETALDIAGIFLCSLIIIYLVRNKIKHRRLLLDAFVTNPGKTFKASITQQIIKQQAEKILYLVSGPLANELIRLKEMAAVEEVFAYPSWTPDVGAPPEQDDPARIGLQSPPPVGAEPDPYIEVTQLAQEGLSPQQIADKVKLPLGEIELLLKLYRVRQ